MAGEIPGFSWSLPANADYSGSTTVKNRFTKIVNDSGTAEAARCGKGEAATAGVAQNKPISGEATTLVSSGVVFVDTDGEDDAATPAETAINPGDPITSAADGKAAKAVTAGSVINGYAYTGIGSGVSGVILVKLVDGPVAKVPAA